jgi:hypothetical protein
MKAAVSVETLYLSTTFHAATSHKTMIFIFTIVSTSNFMEMFSSEVLLCTYQAVLYNPEVYSMNRFRVFANKVLRRIYASKR